MNNVQVLMSAYNGERFIRAQIDSILLQEGVNVRLLIRDDGSTDATLNIIKEYIADNRVTLIEGVNVGFRKSFLWLLDNSPEADYYAFSDQDDVWEPDKLSTAVSMIRNHSQDKSLLYTSALKRVNEELDILSVQSFPHLKLDCYSELVRHRFAGCTYVFNDKLRHVCDGCSSIDNLEYGHDGFIALMCWLTGGEVLYDDTAHIMFRRYGTNTSIDGKGIGNRIRHELSVFTTRRKYKSNVVKVIVGNYLDSVAPQYRDLVITVAGYDTSWKKWIHLFLMPELNCGIPIANILFRFGILFRCM